MAVFKAKAGFEDEFELITRKINEVDAETSQAVEDATLQVQAQIKELELNVANIAAEVAANYAGKLDTLNKLLDQVSEEVIESDPAPLVE